MNCPNHNSKLETRNSQRALPPQAAGHRGVLILVVLSLLFLFVLIAITFVLVATRQHSASKQFAKLGVTAEVADIKDSTVPGTTSHNYLNNAVYLSRQFAQSAQAAGGR